MKPASGAKAGEEFPEWLSLQEGNRRNCVTRETLCGEAAVGVQSQS